MILVRTPVLYVTVCVLGLVLLANCRRQNPSLVDLNRDPNTFITSSPPETSDTDFLVHLYWRGTDEDGVVVRYIWTVTDTVLPPLNSQDNPLNWNPANRLEDLLVGQYTDRTDSIFVFKGYREVGGSGVLRARQVFNIAAIDDNGKIDDSPARLQFFSNGRGFPEVFFTLKYTPRFPTPGPRRTTTLCRGCPIPPDTVGMYQDFTLSWHGETKNGQILGFKWIDRGLTFPDLDGNGIAEFANYPEIDTFLYYPNKDTDVLASGKYTLFMTALDEAAAQSQNEKAEVVVNFDPEAKFTDKAILWYNPRVGPIVTDEIVDLTDAIPDTVPYGSILKVEFSGHDSPFDSLRPPDDPGAFPNYNPLRFAFRYVFTRDTGGPQPVTGQHPWTAPFDTDPAQIPPPGFPIDTDSISLNIGSAQYFLQVRSQDENDRFDGTPDTVVVYGNLPPTIDSLGLYYVQPGAVIQTIVTDTLALDVDHTNNFSPGQPAGLTYDLLNGFTFTAFDDSTNIIQRTFVFRIRSTGRDHPRDPDDAGVKSWKYQFIDPDTSVSWGPENAWVNGDALDAFDFPISITMTAIGRFDPSNPFDPLRDFWGVKYLLNDPPKQLGDQTVTLQGRDSAIIQGFTQKLRLLDPSSGNWILQEVNTFNDGSMGRMTPQLRRPLHIKLVR